MLSVRVQNYLESVEVFEDYGANLNTLCTICDVLDDLNVSNGFFTILLKYNNINKLVGNIVFNNLEEIMDEGSSILSNNKIFRGLIDSYCLVNNSFFDVKVPSDYYRFIDNINVLSLEQEEELFGLLHSSNKRISDRAKDIIVFCNLRLVRSIAYRYAKNSSVFSFDDLMEEGNKCLIEAIWNFDMSRDNKFSTFAHKSISLKLNTFCCSKTKSISYSYDFLEKMRIYLKIKREYIKINGEVPSLDYMKSQMREKLRNNPSDEVLDELIRRIEVHSLEVLSLSSPVSQNEGFYLEDTLPDDNVSFDVKLDDNELPEIFERVFEQIGLSDRDKEIIYYKYGLNGYPELTLEKIGSIVGVTYQRVRQIEKRVLKTIRNNSDCVYMLSGYHK